MTLTTVVHRAAIGQVRRLRIATVRRSISEVSALSEHPPTATHQLGALHERHLAAQGLRRSRGSFYTPDDVVEGLLDVALMPLIEERAGDADGLSRIRILDPSCGTGNFLAGAARRLVTALSNAGLETEVAARIAFGRCVVGVDIDIEAVVLGREALAMEAGCGLEASDLESTVIAADALALERGDSTPSLFDDAESDSWRARLQGWDCPDGFDLVIGNPPFLSQLSSSTARTKNQSAGSRRRFGEGVAALTDTSAVFVLLGMRLTRPGGTLCMIQPLSFLAARDAGGVRRSVLDAAALTDVWIPGERVFEAAVDVCAFACVLGFSRGEIQLRVGRSFERQGTLPPSDSDQATWSRFLAESRGLPTRDLVTSGVLGDVTDATSDFRDFYYGLAPHVIDQIDEAPTCPRVATVGLVDPARIRWGERSTRLDRRRIGHPRVRTTDLEEKVRRRAERLLVPKVLVATQSRVLEAAVDENGSYIPSVPLISLLPREVSLWHVLAVVSAPPVLLIAVRRHSGAALAQDALRLGARDCLDLPLPADRDGWNEAARLIEAASGAPDDEQRLELLREYANVVCSAYGCPEDLELVAWWWERLTGVGRDATQGRLGTP